MCFFIAPRTQVLCIFINLTNLSAIFTFITTELLVTYTQKVSVYRFLVPPLCGKSTGTEIGPTVKKQYISTSGT